MSEFGGIETVHGHFDLGTRIGEGLEDFLHLPEHDKDLPEDIRKGLPKADHVMAVKDEPAKNAHYRSYTLDGTEAQEITSPYPGRKVIRVTVESGGPARIGADNQIGSAAGDPRSVAVASGGFPLVMTHTDKVFAHGPAATVVGVVEEHY